VTASRELLCIGKQPPSGIDFGDISVRGRSADLVFHGFHKAYTGDEGENLLIEWKSELTAEFSSGEEAISIERNLAAPSGVWDYFHAGAEFAGR
jgi:hypothetical protein